jgi:hypothetical protein
LRGARFLTYGSEQASQSQKEKSKSQAPNPKQKKGKFNSSHQNTNAKNCLKFWNLEVR